ncbi:thioredoxin family protein [Thermosipho atlanticus]|uniref:Thioredoxin n=1 Tax=Thermosipho atlanticus DSM 15807 TaxID=1123380 RepID=A0A1M5U8F7_9BACT|nr:thioredoxin family protein [Thermosipho atlanticus]SHH59198.1 Thioredoxin [Thermosipho atlanticus DSM 15807]
MKIYYFKNDNCSVCAAVLPKVMKLSEDYDIDFEIIDVLENPEFAGQHLVLTVPTVLIMENGQELARFARNFSISDISSFIDRYLEVSKN